MPYDITDAYRDIQEMTLVLNSVVKVPLVRQQLIKDGLLKEEENKTPRR